MEREQKMTGIPSQFEAELAAAQAAEAAAAQQTATEGDAGNAGDAGTTVVPAEETAAQPAQEPARSGVDERFSELTAQRRAAQELADANARAAAAERARADMMQQQLDAMRAQLARQFPAADPLQEAVAQFQNPDEQALASVVARVLAPAVQRVEQRLQRFEGGLEESEAQRFWSTGAAAKQPAEVKARTEQFYAQYRHAGITRETALKQTLGDMILEGAPIAAAQVAQTQATAQRVAAQNAQAQANVAPSPSTRIARQAAVLDPSKMTADQLWKHLQQHGGEENR